jgi:hypothetical protein
MLLFAPYSKELPESERNGIKIWDVTELRTILRGTDGIIKCHMITGYEDPGIDLRVG